MVQHSGKFISYLRVSTAKQEASGLGLEAQRKAVLDYLNGGSWELLAEYTVEKGSSLALALLERYPHLFDSVFKLFIFDQSPSNSGQGGADRTVRTNGQGFGDFLKWEPAMSAQ